MKVYVLYWGIYIQWTKAFATDEEAIQEALTTLANETGWRLVRLEEVLKK